MVSFTHPTVIFKSRHSAGLWPRHYRQTPSLRRRRGLRKMAAKYFEHVLANQSLMSYAL